MCECGCPAEPYLNVQGKERFSACPSFFLSMPQNKRSSCVSLIVPYQQLSTLYHFPSRVLSTGIIFSLSNYTKYLCQADLQPSFLSSHESEALCCEIMPPSLFSYSINKIVSVCLCVFTFAVKQQEHFAQLEFHVPDCEYRWDLGIHYVDSLVIITLKTL